MVVPTRSSLVRRIEFIDHEPVTTTDYEVLIIGGGPGGSTAATLLAQAGRKVLLLEKEYFPRFHVGESLLPYNRVIFEELGLTDKLQAAGFVRKLGAQFHLGNGSKYKKFVFSQGRYTRETQAIQVERAPFDHLLLNHAAATGADVRQGWTVTRFDSHPTHVIVHAQNPQGQSAQFQTAFLIDASGRSNLTGNQQGLRIFHPRLKKLALFGHFTGVQRDPGGPGGDTVIVRLENKWFWLIPISTEKTSVGCVLDQAEFNCCEQPPEQLFHRLCQSSAVMRERMLQACPASPVHVTTDFSYRNRRFIGPRLLRVGDAAGFMDPIFSAGVYLAMLSGKLAAQTLLASLQARNDGSQAGLLARYEKRIQSAMRCYWQMVEHFYTTPFMEILLEPREKWNLPAAVNAILAGELEGGWALRWRLRLFFWLIRLQNRFALVPRISFAEPAPPQQPPRTIQPLPTTSSAQPEPHP